MSPGSVDGFAVDRAFVDQLSFRIDDEHVRRVGGAIFVADLAVRDRAGSAVEFIFQSLICFFASSGRKISLRARRGGINRQPDDSFAGEFLLQGLHVVARVVLLHERAARVEPFQNDVFALVNRLTNGFCRLAVGEGEVGRGRADLGRFGREERAGAEVREGESSSFVFIILFWCGRDFRRGGLKMIQDERLGEQFRQNDRLVRSRRRIEHV